jgi:hypothetical protein
LVAGRVRLFIGALGRDYEVDWRNNRRIIVAIGERAQAGSYSSETLA